ncbi:hypothetical protein [Novisyntrophococcus fermenticellae]|uniref:hypothetical protein n=1 Tax=Novisyntrophococcus fermenticellae TaxID=2068655 RepID=UPI001E5DA306|nr:hypothetical protein [Novisyntrophococcus fermenticellae]
MGKKRERLIGALQKIEDINIYRILKRSFEILDECVDPWNLTIWYNRMEAEIELLWELRQLETELYGRLKGTLEDYFRIFLIQLQKEENL